MIPLLEDPRAYEFDIIAVQEPWRNRYTPTSYCPSQWPFYLAYPPYNNTRVCCYINKKLNLDSWNVTNHSADFQTITIRLEDNSRPMDIHNIYHPSPRTFESQLEGTLTLLPEHLRRNAISIVLGDFNLHHPMWSKPERAAFHAAADSFLDIARDYSLSLVTPPGMTTWSERGSESTIDLVFLSNPDLHRVLRCATREDLSHSSDHKPIETLIEANKKQAVTTRRRNWKKIDPEALLKALDLSNLPVTTPSTREQIDSAVTELTREVTKAIEATVPWARSSEYDKPYWNEECRQAIIESRRTHLEHLRLNSDESFELRRLARNNKVTVIRKAKQQAFRQGIAEATASSEGLWKIHKWAKQAGTGRSLPQLPEIRQETGGDDIGINDLQEKLQAFRKQFFPEEVRADTSDIELAVYPEPLATSDTIDEDEIQTALRRVASKKAPGPDQIPNSILKAASLWLVPRLAPIFTAALRLGYHPHEWKRAVTLILRKPNKADYTSTKAYRPIALLNTMGKLLEIVIARRLTELAETNRLLPETQMGARRGRSTASALQLITEQIHTIWRLPGEPRVATILCMDITGAFDNASHIRLLHNLQKRQVPTLIVNWVASFLGDRTTKLRAAEGESPYFNVTEGIPQGSSVSPILFLFFIADLLDTVNSEGLRTSPIGFVDDISILTYSGSTERNCEKLKDVHQDCQRWAEMHGAKFAPEKYELIHFTRNHRRFNMEATIDIEGTRLPTKPFIRVLGVQVDSKLKWSAHINSIKSRYESQLLAFGRITRSTWGASFRQARLIYSAVLRPTISYASNIWYSPRAVGLTTKATDKTLETMQNRGLRSVTGAYKAVGGPTLEKESGIPPINLYLEKQAATYLIRTHSSPVSQFIRTECERIRLRHPVTRSHLLRQKPTPINAKLLWLRKEIPEQFDSAVLRLEQPTHDRPRPETWKSVWQRRTQQKWDERWTGYVESFPPDRRSPSMNATSHNPKELHANISKATSSLITQIRTEKIGLNAFLSDMRVPGYLPSCGCGWARQTAKHIVRYCPDWQNRRAELVNLQDWRNYQKLIETPAEARIVARWFQRTGLLPQFNLGLDP